jgi:hypothetical protein
MKMDDFDTKPVEQGTPKPSKRRKAPSRKATPKFAPVPDIEALLACTVRAGDIPGAAEVARRANARGVTYVLDDDGSLAAVVLSPEDYGALVAAGTSKREA